MSKFEDADGTLKDIQKKHLGQFEQAALELLEKIEVNTRK